MSLHGFQLGSNRVQSPKYYGKYRAVVTKIQDPKVMGRIKVSCPKVLGDYESNWCMPCLPYGYCALPKIGDSIWIEFEEGDPDKPIWVGVWYKETQYNLDGTKKDTIIINSDLADLKLLTPSGKIYLN
jgi:hypothetical protein